MYLLNISKIYLLNISYLYKKKKKTKWNNTIINC